MSVGRAGVLAFEVGLPFATQTLKPKDPNDIDAV
jgi:hypothetical protein